MKWLLVVSFFIRSWSASPHTCPAGEGSDCLSHFKTVPDIDGAKTFIGGRVDAFGTSKEVTSPIIDAKTGKRTVIGHLADLGALEAVAALDEASVAWSDGQGKWPQMPANERIAAVEHFVELLLERRDEIIHTLMWEICKSVEDATSEFDRTVQYIKATIVFFRKEDASSSAMKVISGTLLRIRRAAVGIILCIGPFNYPFNETYATLIPALLMGNIAILKLPAVGGLAHMLTIDAFMKAFPKGVIHFVSGSGRKTLPPMMRTGKVDILAFIGGSKTADTLAKEHPSPHRLKLFLQLEGKNLGVITENADIDVAVAQTVVGSTTYNGQRCTAIKLVFVHERVVNAFLPKFISAVSELKAGLPWEEGVKITPLPEPGKPDYLREIIADALSQGASIVNAAKGGGEFTGALMQPAIVYPVTEDMRLWHEEQFGPVIPIAVYSDKEQIRDYVRKSPFGQQAAIFSRSQSDIGWFVDIMSTVVGRVNINTQCSRSPDSVPFTGRRSSALGTMSISETLKALSIETVVAAKDTPVNNELVNLPSKTSNFLR